MEFPHDRRMRVSHETIYRWVFRMPNRMEPCTATNVEGISAGGGKSAVR